MMIVRIAKKFTSVIIQGDERSRFSSQPECVSEGPRISWERNPCLRVLKLHAYSTGGAAKPMAGSTGPGNRYAFYNGPEGRHKTANVSALQAFGGKGNPTGG